MLFQLSELVVGSSDSLCRLAVFLKRPLVARLLLLYEFFWLLQKQALHRGIGLDGSRVYSLFITLHHPTFHAEAKDPVKQHLEQSLRVKPAGAGEGGVPWQGLIEPVVQKVEQIQPQAAVLDKAAVGDNVLQACHQAELEERHRIDALLAALTIEGPGQLMELV